MQKNVPKYTPDWVPTVPVGRDVEARGLLRPVQRPADAAVVRQPAGDRVPPDAGHGRPPRPPDPPRARPRPARGRRVRRRGRAPPTWCVRRSPRSGSPARSRPAAPRACTCSSRSRRRRAGGRRRRDPGHRRPCRAARPDHRHDRVHEGGPWRQGVRRRDPGRRRDGRRRLQPAGAARCAGVVPGGLGRPRRRRPGRLHDPHRRGAARRSRSVGRGDARLRSGCPPTWSPRATRSLSPG